MVSRRYFESLTSLRGIAAWWIVLYHFGSFLDDHLHSTVNAVIGKGYLAVDLFFILSGFVIYYSYKEMEFRKGEILLFIVRRFARIYPLHIFVLLMYLSIPVLYFVFSKFDKFPEVYSKSYYFLSIFLVQNWGVTDRLAWNVPAWSISTEWFSYMMFPILILVVSKYFSSNSRRVLLAAFFYGLIVFYFAYQGADSLGTRIPQNGLLRCFFQFSLGAIICSIFIENPRLFSNQIFRYGLLVVSVLLVSAYVSYDIEDYYVISLAFAALILFLAASGGGLDKISKATPLYFLGEISYSTYMIHFIIREWFKLGFVEVDHQAALGEILLVLGLIFVASILLYRWVERPAQTRISNVLISFLNLRRR